MHADGNNLYLQVHRTKDGKGYNRSWIFRYMFDGKTRDMGLGSLQNLPLADARKKAIELHQLVKDGTDPIERRNAKKSKPALPTKTFKACWTAFVDEHQTKWKNSRRDARAWRSSLEKYCAAINNLSVREIDNATVIRILKQDNFWSTKPRTASCVRNRIEQVLDWARVQKYREGENPARWRGNLAFVLPPHSKMRKAKRKAEGKEENHAAVPYSEVASLITEIKKSSLIGARILELIILTAARTSEVLEMVWDEVDFYQKVWTIPPARMKNGKQHRVPLSDPAIAILKSQLEVKQSELVFPGQDPSEPWYSIICLQLLHKFRPGVTVHGFRSSFRTWCGEVTDTPRDVAEAALSHYPKGVEGDYQRGDLLTKRRKLMNAWAEFVNKAPVKVLNLENPRKRVKAAT
jgi:integrase